MKMNVGCGEDMRGDIRIDIRHTKAVTILADCYFLPFRNDTFEEVDSIALLEHCLNPFNALKEQIRVLKTGSSLICETDCARYWRFHLHLQNHVRHFKSKIENYNPSDTHYMIFYPENVEKMFKLLKLKKVSWRYKKEPWKKIDRIFRALRIFEENMYPRFIVRGVK